MTVKDVQGTPVARLMKDIKQQELFIAEAVGRLLEQMADADAGLSSQDLRTRVELLREDLRDKRDHNSTIAALSDLSTLLRQDSGQLLLERQRKASQIWVEALTRLEQSSKLNQLQEQVSEARDRLEMLLAIEAIAELVPSALAASGCNRQTGVMLHLEQTRQALIRLLDSLLRTAAIGPQAAQLRERLLVEADSEPLLLAQAGEEAASLSLQALQLERQAFANYLNTFRQSLQKGRETTDRCRADNDELLRHQAGWSSQFELWQGEAEYQLDTIDDIDELKRTLRASLAQLSQLQKKNITLLESSITNRRDSLDSLERQLRQTQAEAAEHKQQAQHYSELSRRDALTQLPNRLAYEERAEHEVQRWRRYGKPLAMAVVDIDLFKRINDRFGHLVGDRVLQAVSSRLRSSLREVDFVARIGGEEFLILLPNTSIESARRVLERLREQLASMPFRFRGEMFNITASIGLARAEAGDAGDSLYARADDALTLAKQQGRNRLLDQNDVMLFDTANSDSPNAMAEASE